MADNGFERLRNIYRIVSPKDVTGQFELEKLGRANANESIISTLLDVLVNTVDSSGASGVLSEEEIRSFCANAGVSTNSDYLKFYDNKTNITALGTDVDAKKTDSANLCVMSVHTPMLGFPLRDVNRTSVFLSSASSYELSRCVPRLEVNFETAFPKIDQSRTDATALAGLSSKAPTLLRYLLGDAKSYSGANLSIAQAQTKKLDGSTEGFKVVSGMELFTFPQTMVSPNASSNARTVPVLDKFSGLMSIDSLEVTVVPAGGIMVNKTARLNLVVHDRSRLHEVASLIRPDAYSQTTVSLTYGWSHPDKTGANPVGDLINQMIVKNEKYNVYNSSFSFSGAGVKITLSLAMKGFSETRNVRISNNEKLMNLDLTLQELSKTISFAKQSIAGLSKPSGFESKDIRVFQIIDAAASNDELIDNFTESDRTKLKSYLENLKQGNKNNKQVVKELSAFMEDMNLFLDSSIKRKGILSTDTGALNKSPRKDDVLGDKFTSMVGGTLSSGALASPQDPFIDPEAEYWSATERKDMQLLKTGKLNKPSSFVSLAKVMLHYVGVPLRAVGSFSEVQFLFYPLNSESGLVRGTSLASFPIEVQYLHDVLADHSRKKNSSDLTIAEFVQLLASTTIQDVRHPAYGMRDIFVSRRSKEQLYGNPDLLRGKTIENASNNLAKRFKGVFRKPVVETFIECRGGRPFALGETQTEKSDKRILRIHVYDKLSSAYDPTLKAMRLQQGMQDYAKGTADLGKLEQLAAQVGLNVHSGKFESYDQLKSFVSQTVPVLKYGASNSGVLNASLSSMQNSDLATVNMQRAMGQPYNSDPNSSTDSAIPLRVQPTQLDLTLVGTPLMSPAQQYFVDFNTGTTADDLYTLQSLSHTIGSGQFTTTAKFIPMNAYGVYESISSKVKDISDELKKMSQSKDDI